MNFPFNSRLRTKRVYAEIALCGLLAGLITPRAARACGPDFPARYLDASESRLLESPEAIFAREVERIAPRLPLASGAGAEKPVNAQAALYSGPVAAVFQARAPEAQKQLEAEMSRFGAAAAAYRLGKEAADRSAPAEGRLESERREARDEAVKWFQLTRLLVEKEAADPENLVTESIGWEAYAEFQTGNFLPAIDLYLKQHARGDPTAVNSLRFVMRRLFREETWRKNGLGEKLANDGRARRVWTAWLLAQGDNGFGWGDGDYLRRVAETARAWAALLQQAGVREMEDADRFAWVAYEGGQFALAVEWVRLAAKESGAAEWIRGKLALRAGDLAAGETHLRAAWRAEELGPQRAVIAGELGRVCLARDHAADALSVWLEGGHWEDAAYVAERVMTLAELRAFVDARAGETRVREALKCGDEREQNGWRMSWGQLEAQLRQLLARRLMRANRGEEALGYFPEETAAVACAYLADVRMGFDLEKTDVERAAGFWRAAKIARERGMELLGTELEPDWAIWGGSFDTGSAAKAREALAMRPGGTFATTTEELGRVAEHVVPEQRFHYRYRAAQLAWWAAALMPNDAEETAAVLSEAGRWLKNRDPRAAKAFYEALVVRCGRTELGKAAAAKRWFSAEAKEVNP